MRQGSCVFVMLCVPLLAACSGGSSSGGILPSPPSGNLTASFTPEQPNPGANSAAMSATSSSGSLVTVSVNVTDTSGVYGAAFDVGYDPAKATFVSHAAGSVLESGGHTPVYDVRQPQPGVLVIGASRMGNVPAVDVSGTRSLIRLTFRVTQAGDNPLTYGASPQLLDGQVQPQPLPGVSWYTGSLRAN